MTDPKPDPENRIRETLRRNLVQLRDGVPTELAPYAIADIALQELNKLEDLLRLQADYIRSLRAERLTGRP